jgi:NADPH2:quinone reductase
MKAAFYERVGPAAEVLQVGDLPRPDPAAGEVRVRVQWSGVNPSDVKSRMGLRSGMPFPRVIPHSDGMGVIDAVGEGVSAHRVGERVWLWNAAWGRPHGTACEWVCLASAQAVPLPDAVSDEAGACLGIPALTALHSVLMDGGVAGKTVLIAGGAGAVGHYAVQPTFSDGHDTGIFSWDYLYRLGADQEAWWAQYAQRIEAAGTHRDAPMTAAAGGAGGACGHHH